MKKWKKVLIILSSIVLTIGVTSGLTAYFLLLHHYKGNNVVNNWYKEDTFKIERIKTIEKKKDKDFVILNLADVQMCDLDNIPHMSIIHDEITEIVSKIKPDLITLTGDQTWSNENLISLTALLKWLDMYQIPYAPIFGNHDHGNDYDSAVAGINYCCDLYENGKYSLFNRGPTNIGSLGNYVINIKEEEKIVKTLYMMDSGYHEMINDNQIEWFKWNAEGIRANNGGEYTEGALFLHKPLPEYAEAYRKYRNGDPTVEKINDMTVSYSLFGSLQNGFFDIAKDMGVKDVVCGHQHGNNFTLKYEGVRLTFATKTGQLVGYYDDGVTNLNGATFLTIIDEETKISNYYVPSGKYHITDDGNVARK